MNSPPKSKFKLSNLFVILLLGVTIGMGIALVKKFKNEKENTRTNFTSIKIDGDFRIQIKHLPVCFTGELNMIQGEIGGIDKPNLLLTVEPILNIKGAKILKKQITKWDLLSGLTKTMRLSDLNYEGHYGVYICKDDKKEGRCNTKPVTSYEQVQKKSLLTAEQAKASSGQDQIYFFQYATIGKKGIRFLTDFNDLASIKKLLNQWTANIKSPTQKKRTVDRILKLTQSAGSKVLTHEETDLKRTELEIILTKTDYSQCGSTATGSSKGIIKVHQDKSSIPNSAPRKRR